MNPKSHIRMMTYIPAFRSSIATMVIISLLMGCASDNSSRVKSGAVGGALLGAGVGLLIGALGGKPERGLAVGAAIGGAQGAYEGWRQEQDDQRTQQIAEAIRESKRSEVVQQPYATSATRAREELTRFLGVWTMEGWFQEPGEERRDVSAKVNGNIEMTYFVELAYIDLKVTGVDTQLWGSSMFGYDEDDGYSINTRLNTLPESIRTAGGTFDQTNRTFTFSGPDYRLVVRFENPDRFTIETFVPSGGRDQKVEFFKFTRT